MAGGAGGQHKGGQLQRVHDEVCVRAVVCTGELWREKRAQFLQIMKVVHSATSQAIRSVWRCTVVIVCAPCEFRRVHGGEARGFVNGLDDRISSKLSALLWEKPPPPLLLPAPGGVLA